MTAAYLAALVIMPVDLVYFLGAQVFNLGLFLVLGELIVLPIIVARVLVYLGVYRYTLNRIEGLLSTGHSPL